MGIFGFDSVRDMFDGGGAGGSGDTFSTGSNADYTAGGGTNTADTGFVDRVRDTTSNVVSSVGDALRGNSSYTIASGDTLSAIAAENGVTVADLLAANPSITNADRIGAGDSLTIPGGSGAGSTNTGSGSGGRSSGSGSGSGAGSDAGGTEETTEDEVSNVEAAVERYKAIQEASGIEVSNAEIEAMMADPAGFLADRGLTLADLVPNMDSNAEGTTLDPNDPRYTTSDNVTYDATATTAETVGVPSTATVGEAITDTATGRLDGSQYQVDPVTGQIRNENLVDAESLVLDMEGSATGVNADGTTNYTGLALNEYASLNISTMIDTSTAAGKLLAAKLGEGNYTDTKATIIGQMDVLSGEFKDSNGNPRIPPWAQGTHANVMRSIAFNGASGSAAIAASANAIMQATLPIAESEAAFFQTATLKNLDNRQQSILNKAKTLASFDIENLSVRSAAAVNNAKSFLEMDLSNLTREQQAETINVQNRVDAMFTDTAEENVNRRLNIKNDLENRQFYDRLQLEATTFNASAINASRENNANRTDSASQFNIERTMARDQYESTMARIVDESNVAWRREVYTTNTRMEFEAASADVKNAIGLTTEGMNRMWDRVDSQLDYIWRSTEADEQRDFEMLLEEIRAAAAAAGAKSNASGSLWGSLIGGAATILASDERLKENVEYYDTMPNGVKVYTWDWNDTAKSLGVDNTPPFGVIAQEIMKTHTDAVTMGEDGYLRVNYGKIQ